MTPRSALRPALSSAALALALLLAVPAAAQSLPDWAAPSGPAPPGTTDSAGPGGPPPPPPPPPPVPVDGGLSLLALAGGASAVRRLRSRRA